MRADFISRLMSGWFVCLIAVLRNLLHWGESLKTLHWALLRCKSIWNWLFIALKEMFRSTLSSVGADNVADMSEHAFRHPFCMLPRWSCQNAAFDLILKKPASGYTSSMIRTSKSVLVAAKSSKPGHREVSVGHIWEFLIKISQLFNKLSLGTEVL